MADDGSVGIWSLAKTPAQLAFTIDNVATLPDQQSDGKPKPSAMAFLGNTRLAIATSTGAITIVDLDLPAWLRRSDQLDGKAVSPAN